VETRAKGPVDAGSDGRGNTIVNRPKEVFSAKIKETNRRDRKTDRQLEVHKRQRKTGGCLHAEGGEAREWPEERSKVRRKTNVGKGQSNYSK